jgi:hypothetical protein
MCAWVFSRHKNARYWAGIGEDLQQLLLVDGHAFLQKKTAA